MYRKQGYEVYDISITFSEEETNPKETLDKALSKIPYECNMAPIAQDEDGYYYVNFSVKMPCSWFHKNAFWDDNGGGTAEDTIEYVDKDPYELESYLKQKVNASYISVDYNDFIEYNS